MRVAVMQPYFFPYLGYFEMMKKVDVFVFFTDVQFVRGWINRNRISLSNYITIPLEKSPQKTNIEKKIIANDKWVDTHLKTFRHTYGKRVEKNNMFMYYEGLKKYTQLCPLLCDSIMYTAKHLGVEPVFDFSSKYPSDLKAQDRIIDLCEKLKATTYVNLSGGKNLYDTEAFSKKGIELEFMPEYEGSFLSVLDGCFNEENCYL